MPVEPRRRHGSADAVVLGLAAMLGTGVFIVFAPAARSAGAWLPLAVLLAAAVAAASAFAEADLAAEDPGPGAGYRYGRELLAPWVGRLAGVAGLLASAAAAAAAGLVFANYVLPGHPRLVAVPLIVVVCALNVSGLRWTVRGAWVLVPSVFVVLVVVVLIGLTRHVPADWSVTGMAEGAAGDSVMPGGAPGAGALPLSAEDAVRAAYPVNLLGVLTAAGLVFFGFAGFGSAFQSGQPPSQPSVQLAVPLPRPPVVRPGERGARWALPALLLLALVSYLVVAAALVHTLDIPRLAIETAPLAAAVGGSDTPAVGVLVRAGAAAATACALFRLLAGAGGTASAMSRHRDLPRRLGPLGARGVPWIAELVVAAGAVLVVMLSGPVMAVALAACAALVYFALVNLAALRLPSGTRRWPAWTSMLGAPLCLGLAVLLPRTQVVITAVVLVAGCLLSTALARRAARPAPSDGVLPPGVSGGLLSSGAGGDGGLALAGGTGGVPAGEGGVAPDGGVSGLAPEGGTGGLAPDGTTGG
ncbi:MAG: basic amino acid/polyamine antiporter, family [Pseudonocardiales bacterium]|nr:basic amino acid/polyamine antiporter, family [Pseudonocardiales bacterium]